MDKSLFKLLKYHGKTFDDIDFISSTIDEEKLEITKEDFLECAKDVDEVDINAGIELVGKDFYVHTDGDHGYFDFVGLPKKPKRVINLTKELLVGEKAIPAVVIGIQYLDD